MRLALTVLACVAPVVVASLACTYDACPIGVWPYDGQTSVPLDQVIVLRAMSPFSGDLPSLHEAVVLHRVGGARVDLDLEVDLDSGVVRAHPVELLRPDSRYILTYDPERVASSHHFEALPDDGVSVTFRTGAGVRLLDAIPREDGSVAVVFSEPVEPRRALYRVEIEGDDGPLHSAAAHAMDGQPHVVVFTGDLGSADRVRFEAGLVARSGAVLAEDTSVSVDAHAPFDLDVWIGEPDCADGAR